MKILIYGAGVLGSLYAFKLQEAGHDVSLLARGQRLADLRQHGLVMEDMFTGVRTTLAINVVEGLLPGEAYDLVVVMMGKHQVGGVLPALAANGATPDVLFMGNNAAGPGEMVAALGPERVLLGFPQAGGTIKEGVVYYAANIGRARAQAVIGELDGSTTPRLQTIAAAFELAGFETSISPNIDAWLKTHAALILALGAAYYSAGMDASRLAHTRDSIGADGAVDARRTGCLTRQQHPHPASQAKDLRLAARALAGGLVEHHHAAEALSIRLFPRRSRSHGDWRHGGRFHGPGPQNVHPYPQP